MDVLTEFKVPYLGLKDGLHQFEFKIGKAFFVAFDNLEVESADIELVIELDKKTTMVVADFKFRGKVEMPCARCMENVHTSVEGSERIVYKFHGEEDIDDETIVFVPPHLGEIDLSPQAYEIMVVNFPLRVVHEDISECNQDVIEKLKDLKPKVNNNPQWEELLKLKSE
ncbi:YceD family protein [Luteibaculum oceani]|uniref:DUF177 domain-containing protein n=1 Tax=Luteibaculum oceani TaxID=1294296 RepID=A0A5C6VI75_9FLAO|nr:DUF177 domain-containing protein [Luteibaculum oceani]TXC85182.1 DUF177 domain-containing protein [Luteibaculum oceani]